MTYPVTQETVEPATMSPVERERFTDELYATHDRIFAGVSREAFARYVVDSPATRTRIQVFRVRGKIVGYGAFHVFERDVAGHPSLILRAEAGLLPRYRRDTRFGWFMAREAIRAVMRNPGKRVWGLSCATNPATYRTIARHADEVWPSWERPTPPHLGQLMDELAQQFSLRPTDAAQPGVYEVGWQTRQSEAEALGWRRSTHPASQFYVQRNPGYAEGHGLLVLVPITRLGMVRVCMRLVDNMIRRGLTRRQRALTPASLREIQGR